MNLRNYLIIRSQLTKQAGLPEIIGALGQGAKNQAALWKGMQEANKPKSEPKPKTKNQKPVPTHANPADFKGPLAYQRLVLDEKRRQNAYQEQMRDYAFANSPEYAELYKKSRLPNGLVGGGVLGGAGMLGAKYLSDKLGLSGWKKALAYGILGGGGAFTGAYLGSKMGPRRPDEYKNYYYDDNGDRVN